MTVLTNRALNRALLARQLLLERADMPLPAAVEAVGGLQTQYAPAGYVALWSRLRDLRRAALTEAIESREIVQATLMRATIHMVSAADFWPFAAATRPARLAWWLRVQRQQVEGIDLAGLERLIREVLADGPRRQAEIAERLEADGLPRAAFGTAAQLVDLVRVPPSGTWERRRADLYGLAEDWLGPPTATEEDGQELLVRRYLGGFGPAALADIANWAGLPVATIRQAVSRIEVRRFRDEAGRELVDLLDAPLPEPDTPAPVRFLPVWEALLLVHARRTFVLPERFRGRIFNTRTPHSFSTFLVDGAVAGTWRHEAGRIVLEPFERLPKRVAAELEEEAERLAAFHAEAE